MNIPSSYGTPRQNQVADSQLPTVPLTSLPPLPPGPPPAGTMQLAPPVYPRARPSAIAPGQFTYGMSRLPDLAAAPVTPQPQQPLSQPPFVTQARPQTYPPPPLHQFPPPASSAQPEVYALLIGIITNQQQQQQQLLDLQRQQNELLRIQNQSNLLERTGLVKATQSASSSAPPSSQRSTPSSSQAPLASQPSSFKRQGPNRSVHPSKLFCGACSQIGHVLRNCPHRRRPGCFSCGDLSHKISDCPRPLRRRSQQLSLHAPSSSQSSKNQFRGQQNFTLTAEQLKEND